MGRFGIGQSVKRIEDTRLLTGNASYTDDINFKNQAFMYILRSPFSSAKIKNISLTEALKVEGVISIIDSRELEKNNVEDMRTSFLVKNKDGKEMNETTRNVLSNREVRYVGDPILAIIAEELEIAEEAAEKVQIDFEQKKSVTDIVKALEDNAPIVRNELKNNLCFDWELGNKEDTLNLLDNSEHRIEIELRNNRLIPNPMECRSTVGIYNDKDGKFKLYCSSQGVHSLKRKLAMVLNLPKEKIDVITRDVGGGFGMKIFNYPEYVLTLAASKITNRIIKWRASRTESFLSDIHGRDHFSKAVLGLDKHLHFTALKVETIANIGSYISDFAVFIPTYAGTGMLTGCYKILSAYANVKGAYTNTNPTDAYRGAGRPEAAYLIERLVDKAARSLGISPVELRLKNLIEETDMPYKTAFGHVYDSGNFKKNMKDALILSDYDNFDKRKEESQKKGFFRGIGISTYIEACGGGGPEYAEVLVGENGNISVKIGSQSNGQGHETSYAQIVSEVLGVDIENIQVMQGNSIEIPNGSGTGGSRSTPVGGSALHLATNNLIKKSKKFVSRKLNVNEQEINYENGYFFYKSDSFSLAEISSLFSSQNDSLSSYESWAPPSGTFTYPNGTHICELEIDKETGMVDILTYSIVDDFGKVINPLLLEGQVHGGTVQGIGQALLEETIYDSTSGQLLSGSFMDYALPRASDLPNFKFSYNEILCKTNLLGVKGAGEAGAIGAPPAVINAICNALGIDHIDMPAKPEKIWRVIKSKKKAAE